MGGSIAFVPCLSMVPHGLGGLAVPRACRERLLRGGSAAHQALQLGRGALASSAEQPCDARGWKNGVKLSRCQAEGQETFWEGLGSVDVGKHRRAHCSSPLGLPQPLLPLPLGDSGAGLVNTRDFGRRGRIKGQDAEG